MFSRSEEIMSFQIEPDRTVRRHILYQDLQTATFKFPVFLYGSSTCGNIKPACIEGNDSNAENDQRDYVSDIVGCRFIMHYDIFIVSFSIFLNNFNISSNDIPAVPVELQVRYVCIPTVISHV